MLSLPDLGALTFALPPQIVRCFRINLSLGLVSAEDFYVLHGTRFNRVDLITHFCQILFLLLGLLLSLGIGEGIRFRIAMLLPLWHEPVVLILDLLDAPFAPPGHPVVGQRVEHEAGSFLAGLHATLFSELLPLGLLLFRRAGFLAGQHLESSWHIEQVLALRVLEDLAIRAMFDLLLLLHVEELLVEGAEIGSSSLGEFFRCDRLI